MSPFSISLSFSISLCLSVPVPSPLIISQFPSASLSLFLSLGLLLPPVTPSVSLRTDFMLDAHMNPPHAEFLIPARTHSQHGTERGTGEAVMTVMFLEKAATMLGFRSLSGRGWSWVMAESTLAPARFCEIL